VKTLADSGTAALVIPECFRCLHPCNCATQVSSSYIRGSIDVSLTFGIADDAITYAGSVTASGQVYVPFFGWEGGSLSAGISSGEIWVSVDGYNVDFRL
jgi:hypothetical protein